MLSPEWYRPINSQAQAVRFIDANNTFMNQEVAEWCGGNYDNAGDGRPGWIELRTGHVARSGDWIVKERLPTGSFRFRRLTADEFARTYVRCFLRHDDVPDAGTGYIAYDEHGLLTRDGDLLVGQRADWERPDAPAHDGIAALPRAFSMSPATFLFRIEPDRKAVLDKMTADAHQDGTDRQATDFGPGRQG
jgi:hypothetical protein